MPRKAFVTDLQGAIAVGQSLDIRNLRPGEEDGTINFDYHCNNGAPTVITVLVPGRPCLLTWYELAHQRVRRSWGLSRVTYVHVLHQFRSCPSCSSLSD